MPVIRPYKRTCRRFVDGHYSEGGRWQYICHTLFAVEPTQFIRAFELIQKDLHLTPFFASHSDARAPPPLATIQYNPFSGGCPLHEWRASVSISSPGLSFSFDSSAPQREVMPCTTVSYWARSRPFSPSWWRSISLSNSCHIKGMSKWLEKWSVIGAALVTIIGLPLLLVSLWFEHRVDVVISEQLGAIKKIAQSENGISLNTMLFSDPSNAGIIKRYPA
jgi:hypothetical protein